ncbi:MAG: hypothetical protein MMC33_010626, partial [Icmadophila ericetorum]|nr:hypothetical protein [Icmadophila ericetorum]
MEGAGTDEVGDCIRVEMPTAALTRPSLAPPQGFVAFGDQSDNVFNFKYQLNKKKDAFDASNISLLDASKTSTKAKKRKMDGPGRVPEEISVAWVVALVNNKIEATEKGAHEKIKEVIGAFKERVEELEESFKQRIEKLNTELQDLKNTVAAEAREKHKENIPVKKLYTRVATPQIYVTSQDKVLPKKLAQTAPVLETPVPKASAPKAPVPIQASFAAVAAKGLQTSAMEGWKIVRSKKLSPAEKAKPVVDARERRLIFEREQGVEKAKEEDVMLALNEALQLHGVDRQTRIITVRYTANGKLSVLLSEKARAKEVEKQYRDLLIRAARTVDNGVISMGATEAWHVVKVLGMRLERYLGATGMLMMRREIQSSTGMTLKRDPAWILSERTLQGRYQAGLQSTASVKLWMGSKEDAQLLCSRGLRFGMHVKAVKPWHETGPGTVCLDCCGIGHGVPGRCPGTMEKCTICAKDHKTKDHGCNVSGCKAARGEGCPHTTIKCANCGEKHQATAQRCQARRKAEALFWKGKKLDQPKKPGMRVEVQILRRHPLASQSGPISSTTAAEGSMNMEG